MHPKTLTMYFFHRIAIVSIFGLIAMQASGQEFQTLRILSSDTAYAGEVAEFEFSDPESFVVEQAYIFMTGTQNRQDTIFPESVYSDGSVIFLSFNFPVGVLPSECILYIHPNNGSQAWKYEPIWIMSEPYIITAPEDVLSCYGEDVEFEIEALGSDYMAYQWYFGETLLEGETTPILQIQSVKYSNEGFYKCVLNNEWGADTAGTTLSIHPFQEQPGKPVGTKQQCMGAEESTYALPEDPLIDQYTWNMLPAEAGEIVADGRQASVQWNPEYAGAVRIYAETGLGVCEGPNSDTIDIQMVGPTGSPEICIVGVDETSGYYRLVWNKIDDGSIIAYNVYRESNQAGVYLKLKTVEEDAFSVLVDSSSSPSVLPHSYKITYSDTCGNESDFSPLHKTIHLSANIGTGGENNLNWNHYEGFAFLSYQIMRGANPDSMEVLREVSSNVSSFSDNQPPSGQVFYQVAVSREGACVPSFKSSADYSISVSNWVEINTIGILQSRLKDGVLIYPNPAAAFVNIDISVTGMESGSITLMDITGRQVAYRNIDGEVTRLATEGLENGIYMMKVSTENFDAIKSFVINK